MNEEEQEERMLDWIDEALKRGEGFKSEEEKQEYVKSLGDPFKHPMFATSTEELKDNPMVEALRALKEEDKSFVELATMYKDEGNEWMKKSGKKNMHEAYDRYSHALTFISQAETEISQGKLEITDGTNLNQLKSQILSNRAQASLSIQNFKFCRDDCLLAIQAWPGNMKAHFRRCKSLFNLRRFDECVSAAIEGMQMTGHTRSPVPPPTSDPLLTCASVPPLKEGEEVLGFRVGAGNKDLLALLLSAERELTKIRREKERRRDVVRLKEAEWGRVWEEMQGVGVQLGVPSSPQPPPQLAQSSPYPYRELSSETGESTLRFPLLFLYPQHGQLDVVQGAGEADLLVEHLAQMFPEPEEDEGGTGTGMMAVPWDKAGEYRVSELVVYYLLNPSPSVGSTEEWLESCRDQALIGGGGEGRVVYDMMRGGEEGEGGDLSEAIAAARKRLTERLANFEREGGRGRRKVLVEAHLGCSVLSLARCKLPSSEERAVLSGGLLSLLVFPRSSPSRAKFLQDHKQGGASFFSLDPAGKMTAQSFK